MLVPRIVNRDITYNLTLTFKSNLNAAPNRSLGINAILDVLNYIELQQTVYTDPCKWVKSSCLNTAFNLLFCSWAAKATVRYNSIFDIRFIWEKDSIWRICPHRDYALFTSALLPWRWKLDRSLLPVYLLQKWSSVLIWLFIIELMEELMDKPRDEVAITHLPCDYWWVY